MNSEARRELEILTTLSEGRVVTQRALAQRLGIALGLANLYLKRLARKGHIKVTTIPSRRIMYLLTPQGLARKSRLTYDYMRYSLRLYRDVRDTLSQALRPLAGAQAGRVAIYGTGEAAELAYLTMRDLGIEPAAVIARSGNGRFLGLPVRSVEDDLLTGYDYVIVATLEPPEAILAELAARGVPHDRLVPLRAPGI